jgi:hypothetical protein
MYQNFIPEDAEMENRKEKVKLDDQLLDQVAGGLGYADAVCPHCGENNPDQFYIVRRGPETEILHCKTCDNDFTHYWDC